MFFCRWYPPGHGDIYESFYNSSCFKTLFEQGKEYVFVSNIDNMGATADLSKAHHRVTWWRHSINVRVLCFLDILNFLLNPPNGNAPEFLMEVTDKTRADIKVCYHNTSFLTDRLKCCFEVDDVDALHKYCAIRVERSSSTKADSDCWKSRKFPKTELMSSKASASSSKWT